MSVDYTKVMSERTDDKLVSIVTTDRKDYNSSAIEAAILELEKRNVNYEKDIANFEAIGELEEVDSNLANIVSRFLNFSIDSIIILIICRIVTIPFNAANALASTIAILLCLLIFIGYYILMETKYQKTVGKFVTKTKVVLLNGDKPSSPIIVYRSLSRLIPFDRLSYLFTKNGLHDFFAKTKVVKDN